MPEPAIVDTTKTLQAISGFGASSAWTAPSLGDALAQQLFSPDEGIGLSLLRVRINPHSGDTDELATSQTVAALGAQVWATPWTPPGNWKSNGLDTHGGYLLPAYYQSWAEKLADFCVVMQDRGIPLVMLSAQNEPNWTAEWETCRWTAEDLTIFIRDHLGPALQARNAFVPILAPETTGWDAVRAYGDSVLADATARGFIGAIATHAYGNAEAFPYVSPSHFGKELWETEVFDHSHRFDVGMRSALRVAKRIHAALTIASANAWHYWWLIPRSDNDPENSALTDSGVLTHRAYVIGNWSKFVRPGFLRVSVEAASSQSDVCVTGFCEPSGTSLVLVLINHSSSDLVQSFAFAGNGPDSITPWITSETLLLERQSPVRVIGDAFSFTLPARSVTSFHGVLSLKRA